MGNAKYSVWVLYIVGVLLILADAGTWASIARWVLILTFAAHLLEFFAKRSVMEKAGGSMGHHFVQTMIYGLFHWKPLEEAQNAQGG